MLRLKPLLARLRRKLAPPVALETFPFEVALEHGLTRFASTRRGALSGMLERASGMQFRDRYDPHGGATRHDVVAGARALGYFRDGTGVVLVPYPGQRPQYNPLTIASEAFEQYSTLLHPDSTPSERKLALEHFWVLIGWLESRAVDGIWSFEFPWREIRVPWRSCLAQAVIFDVLFKAHQLSEEPTLLALGQAAFRPLLLPAAEGGLSSRGPDDELWLEEYSPSTRYAQVLNGFISTVLLALNNRSFLGEVWPGETAARWLATIKRAGERYTHAEHVDYARDPAAGPMPRHYYPQMIRALDYLAIHDPDPAWARLAARWSAIQARF